MQDMLDQLHTAKSKKQALEMLKQDAIDDANKQK